MISKRTFLFQAAIGAMVVANFTDGFAQQALDFDTVMAKDGGYAGIVKEFLGTSDPKIIAFVKREGDRYIIGLPQEQRRKGIEKLDAELSALISKAKGPRPPLSTVLFFEANMPKLLIEFIPYEREYPNMAELGRAFEAQRRGDEAQRRAREEAEFGRRLRQLNEKLQ